jgi:hypothetical protein
MMIVRQQLQICIISVRGLHCTRGRKVGNINKVWGATKGRLDGGTGWGRSEKVVHGEESNNMQVK